MVQKIALTTRIKPFVPRNLRPWAINVYLRSHRVYFAAYRRLRRPNPHYIAVSENNYRTHFPPEWTSISIESADIVQDLEREYTLDLRDVKYAYSGHTIEHLSNVAVRRLFSNLFLCMRRGGLIRVECPDLDMLLDDYKCLHDSERRVTKQMLALAENSIKPEKGSLYDQEHVKFLYGIGSYFDRRYGKAMPPMCSVEEFKDKMDTLSNSEFGDWVISLMTPEQLKNSHEHRNWFNFAKLEAFLTAAGFAGVTRCKADETRYGFKMNINKRHRSWCSMYVEAYTP